MVPLADVETALDLHDLPVVERAFEALILFPQGETVGGAKTVDMLCRLLARVSRALLRDGTVMPAGLPPIIAQALDDPMSETATYAVGAKAVADHLYHWRGVYLQHAANGGQI